MHCRVFVADNKHGSSAAESPGFAMSAEPADADALYVPAVFLFDTEAQRLLNRMRDDPRLTVRLGAFVGSPAWYFEGFLRRECCMREPPLKSVSQATLYLTFLAMLSCVCSCEWFK